MARMKPGDIIRSAREKRRWSQKDLADRVGVSQVAIMKVEAGTTKKSKHLPKIAQLLDLKLSSIDASLSQSNVEHLMDKIVPSAEHPPAIYPIPSNQLLGERNLPVYRTARSEGDRLVLHEKAFRDIARPHLLLGIQDAFGVLIVGNTMAREYREGDIAYVDPHALPRETDACMFQREHADGSKEVTFNYLDEPADNSETSWHVSQSNPEKHLTLKKSEWTLRGVLVGKQSGR